MISTQFRDQPKPPLETAIYWTEYVVRHKGAPHLRSAGLDLNWFSYHSIDVFAFICGFILIILYTMKLILVFVCSKLFLSIFANKRKLKMN